METCSANSNRVRSAYATILPLVKHVLKEKDQPQPIPKDLMDATTQWLQKNPPNGKIAKLVPTKARQAAPGPQSQPVNANERPK